MNDRDMITNFGVAVKQRIGAAAVVCVLCVLVGAMAAPMFGGWIKSLLYRKYALYSDCEQRVEATMGLVYVGLWVLCVLAWAFVVIV